MSNVVGLRGESVVMAGEVVPEVVAALEKALEEAKAGTLCGAVVLKIDAYSCCWSDYAGKNLTSYAMLGLIAMAQLDIAASMEGIGDNG